MNNVNFNVMLKNLTYGLIWFVLSLLLALLLKNKVNLLMSDILFIEGILLLTITILSSVSGDPIGLGIQSYQLKHPNDVHERNYNILPCEKGNLNIVLKKSILFSTTTIPLLTGGILTVAMNYLI